MIRPEQHLQTPYLPIRLPSRSCFEPGLETSRTRDDLADEAELFGPVGDGVEVELAEVVTSVVFETVGNDGIVVYAGCETGGESRESSAGVGEEHDEGRILVECAGEDEASRRLIPNNKVVSQQLSLSIE